MTKSISLMKGLAAAGLTCVLAGCSADETAAEASASQPVSAFVSTLTPAQVIDPSAALKAACADRITAKMIDPSAADISYKAMPDETGLQASVALKQQDNGGTLQMKFTCFPTEDGGVITKLIGD